MPNQGNPVKSSVRSAPPRASVKRTAQFTMAGLAMLLGASSWMDSSGPIGTAQASPQSQFQSSGPIAQAPSVTAIVIHVNAATGTDVPTGGSAAAPLKTITFALQQAQPGTIVQLDPGAYSVASGEVFPLALKTGVALRGDIASKGQSTTVIGGGQIISPSFARQNVTILAATNSEISGLLITNPLSRGTGVWVESTNPTITNCTFTGSLREGLFATGTANFVVTDSVFAKNAGNGISLSRAATGTVKNSLFQDTGFGLAIGGTSTVVLDGNQIVQNNSGLFVSDSAQPVLRNNVITDNRDNGIVATALALPDLGTTASPGNNTIRRNGGFDVNNATSGNTIPAVGNNIDPKKISGKVDFTASSGGGPIPTPPSPTPLPTPLPTPTPKPTPTPLPTPSPGLPPSTGGFKDVKGHWAEAYITALADRQIIAGFADGTFRPSDLVTRAQFATIVSKAFKPQPRKPATDFTDVARSYWAYDYIQTASKGGFMAGYPGGLFKPEQRIPKVQLIVALSNGLQYGLGNVSLLTKFQDAAEIPSYAGQAVAAAISRKIVVNNPNVNLLTPNREATRAEVAAVVYQALVDAGQAPVMASPYIFTP